MLQRAVVVRCDGVVGVASLVPRSGVVRVGERGREVGGRAGWIEELGLELERRWGGVAGELLSAGGWGGDECWVWCGWSAGLGLDGRGGGGGGAC